MVVEVAADNMPQPLSLLRNWLVHTPSHVLLDHPQLRPHAVAPGLPFEQEFAPAGFAADEGEAQEVEGLRLAEPALSVLTLVLMSIGAQAQIYRGNGSTLRGAGAGLWPTGGA